MVRPRPEHFDLQNLAAVHFNCRLVDKLPIIGREMLREKFAESNL